MGGHKPGRTTSAHAPAAASIQTRLALAGFALLALGGLVALLALSSSAHAVTGKKALILGSSVSNGSSSREAQRAAALGYTVDVVTDAQWGSMTAAQFADYRLIVVGDPPCSSLPEVVSENAGALADAVMARAGGNARAGNRVLIGTDPVFHYTQGGNKLVDTALDFAQAQDGASGLYLNFSCGDPDYDEDEQDTPDGLEKLLPLLTIDPDAAWTENPTPPCGGAASVLSNADQFSTLKSSDLQGWGCSVHESFPTFPTDWTALAIATDTATKPTCGKDVDTGLTACGQAHVLIAGSGIVVEAPNLDLSPAADTNPTGTAHTVTATVRDDEGVPVSGIDVTFVVTGVNGGAAGTCAPSDCRTSANGQVAFTYTGTAAGDDTINASITFSESRQTATASKTWVSGTAPPTGSADLGVEISASPATVGVGQQITYSILVSNAGPFPAPGTVVTVQLPSSVAFVSAAPSKGSCSGGASTSCSLGTMGVGESASVVVVGTAVAGGSSTAQAGVGAAAPDPNVGANNSATATVTVTGGALPPPEPGKGNGAPLVGRVLVNGQVVEGPVELSAGDVVNVTQGTLELETVNGTAQFAGGTFRFFDLPAADVLRRAGMPAGGLAEEGITELRLHGGNFKRACTPPKRRLSTHAPPRKTRVRSLWGNASGSFRTRGRHSSATVRGTVWYTADRCDGTLTRVREGSVLVTDFRRKRTVIVRAGKTYLAKTANPRHR
jgi:uncharacterized repeat protein (TIGR01451 family)